MNYIYNASCMFAKSNDVSVHFVYNMVYCIVYLPCFQQPTLRQSGFKKYIHLYKCSWCSRFCFRFDNTSSLTVNVQMYICLHIRPSHPCSMCLCINWFRKLSNYGQNFMCVSIKILCVSNKPKHYI